MRNLLHQFKRATKHMKSIIMKLMAKMTKGATTSARVLVEGIVVIMVIPLGIILFTICVIALILFAAFGGVLPAKIDCNNTTSIPVTNTVY